jgi:hypothetical protein
MSERLARRPSERIDVPIGTSAEERERRVEALRMLREANQIMAQALELATRAAERGEW